MRFATSSAATAALIALSLCGSRAQEGNAAPADQALEVEEAKAALTAALTRLAEVEHRLASSEERNLALGESLAAANAEARQYREDYQALRLRMEALGVEAVSKGAKGLEERLLAAVNDLRLADERCNRLSDQLVGLSEAVVRFLAAGGSANADARLAVETALRDADASLHAGESALDRETRQLDEARVVSIKTEFGLVVLGSGEDSGLRPGMPIRIFRKDKPVATGLVVDVRRSIAGAILTDRVSDSETIQVGDVARLDVTPSLTN